MVFVAENNGYAEATPITYHMSCHDIVERVAGYSMFGEIVDGLDVLAVYEAADRAIARARSGQGPSLIECKTYRYFGHFVGDTLTYRTKEEENYYHARDPIQTLRRFLLEHRIASSEEVDRIDREVWERIDDAWRFAEEAATPAPEELLKDVYLNY